MQMNKFIRVFFLALLISGCGTPENSADNDHVIGSIIDPYDNQTQVTPGQQLYFKYCYTCHAQYEEEDLAGITAATISAYIQSVPVMKTRLENELNDEQISLIADFICLRFPDDCNQNNNDQFNGNDNLQADQFNFSYANDIAPIFTQTCDGCHLNGVALGNLSLDNGHADIVNVASDQVPAMNLITPSDLDNSYLWLKLTNTHSDVGEGDVMPTDGIIATTETKTDLDGNDVEIDTLQVIQFWIENGAPE